MEEHSRTLVLLGSLFLAAMSIEVLGARTRLPRVTLLILFGCGIGPSGLDLLPDLDHTWFPVVSHIALLMVGFLLGESLSLSRLRENGRAVLSISLCVVVVTALVVAGGSFLLGVPLEIALVLGGIATATDPAATTDVVHEVRAQGRFSRTLLGIVAVDDAWGLVVFGLLLAFAQGHAGNGDGVSLFAVQSGKVLVAIALGVGLGLPMALLTGRIRPGEPTLIEALGVVLLCGGIALWLEVSFLLSAMTLGAVVANVAKHHKRPFHEIENVEWPFMILFFVGAGASLELGALASLGSIGVGYVLLRGAARVLGSVAGGGLAGDVRLGHWMGLALMPQAGVAVGMALVASQELPSAKETLLPIAIASTVLFELIGPPLTRFALVRGGEVQAPAD